MHSLSLQPWLNRCILFVEVAHVRHQIAHHIHVRQRVNLAWLTQVRVDFADACQRIRTADVHRTRAANALATRSSECQCWIDFILNQQQCIQHHRCTIVQIHFVLLHVWLFIWLIGIPSINFECFDSWLLGGGWFSSSGSSCIRCRCRINMTNLWNTRQNQNKKQNPITFHLISRTFHAAWHSLFEFPSIR